MLLCFCYVHTYSHSALVIWSDMTVICDEDMVFMLWGNVAHFVKSSDEDLLHFSNKIEAV